MITFIRYLYKSDTREGVVHENIQTEGIEAGHGFLMIRRAEGNDGINLDHVIGKIFVDTCPEPVPPASPDAELDRLRAERDRWKTAYAETYTENTELRSALHDLRHPLGRPKP